MWKRFLLMCGMLLVGGGGTGATVHAQFAVVRGFVTDRTDGEALLGVNIVLSNDTGAFLGAVSDGDGIYAISRVPPGQYRIRASFVGYEVFEDTLDVRHGELRSFNLSIAPASTELDEVVIESEGEGGAARITAGLQTVKPRDIDLVPVPDVSGDLAAYLTTLPGVVSIGDRGGQLFIRGGEPSHNAVLLDGMYVHQPFHILGFFSAFPSDILNRADVYAGGYGSQFNGRVSSFIDVYARNGSKRGYEGAVSLAPFVSSVSLEGPLVRDRVSFLVSGRRSVIEQAAAQYVGEELPYAFGDYFGKMHAIINSDNQFSFSMLQTFDRGTLGEPSEDRTLDEVRWTNRAYGIRYLFLSSGQPFLGELLFSVSQLDTELGPRDNPLRSSRIEGFHVGINITNFVGRAEWRYGLFFRPMQSTSVLGGLYQNFTGGTGRRSKAGIYLEPDIHIGGNFRLRPGLIGSLFPSSGAINPSLEGRLRMVWDAGPHEISGSIGRYHQEIVGLNDRRDATNIFTAWVNVPGDTLTRATHALLGYRVSLIEGLEVAVEGYYKWLSNIYIAEWTSFPRFTTRLQRASGRARGLDVRVEIRRPAFYAYVNYGLAAVRYDAQQATLELWYGTESLRFNPSHDRRHQVNALFSTSILGIDVSARWNFGSGLPYNRVVGFDGFVHMHGITDLFGEQDEQRVIYDRPFKGRLPAYHRLDISVDRTFDFQYLDLTIQAGVINAYNRKNLLALDLFSLRRTDQLPIIPTLGLKVEF